MPGTVEVGEEVVVHAMGCMTNSNYGGELCGPMVCAISEILDSPLGAGPPVRPFSGNAPFVGVDAAAGAPAAGWAAYEGQWRVKGRAQTLDMTAGRGQSAGVEFSHLRGLVLPLVGCAARRGAEMLRLPVSSLDATLDFGSRRSEVSLSLCTGGARLECIR